MKGELQLNHHVPKCEYLHAFLFFFTQPTFKHTGVQQHNWLSHACHLPTAVCTTQNYARCELLNKCHYVCAHQDDNKIRSQ